MRPKYNWILMSVATIAIAVGVAFGAGTVYGRNSASTTTVTVTGSGGGGTTQTSSAAGQAAGTGLRPVEGTIASVTGQTLKITTPAGTALTVNLSSSAKVASASAADASALTTGANVLVLGQRQADGNLSGSAVLLIPAGFLNQ